MMMYFVQSLLILTLFFGTYRLILRSSVDFNFNRLFLLSGIVLGLLLPLIPLNFQPPQTDFIYLTPELVEGIYQNSASQPQTSTKINSLWNQMINNPLKALGTLYIIGVLAGLLQLLLGLLMIARTLKSGEIEIEHGIKIVRTRRAVAPFSFFNWIIINPDTLKPSEIDTILIHERVHINQWHQLDVFLAEALRILLWFYPPTHWYASDVRDNLEYIADRDSVLNGLEAKSYQLQLLKFSSCGKSPELANGFSKKIIKRRIIMLNKLEMKKSNWIKGVLPLLFLVSLGVSVVAQQKVEKIKKVIIVTEDGQQIEKQDVKVLAKTKDGVYEEMDADKVEMTPDTSELTYMLFENKDSVKLREALEFDNDSMDNKGIKIWISKMDSLMGEESLAFSLIDGMMKLQNSDGEKMIFQFDLDNMEELEETLNELENLDMELDKSYHFEWSDKESKEIDEKVERAMEKAEQERLRTEIEMKKAERSIQGSDRDMKRAEHDMKKLQRKMKKLEREMEQMEKQLGNSYSLSFNDSDKKMKIIIDSELGSKASNFEEADLYLNGVKVHEKDKNKTLESMNNGNIESIQIQKKDNEKGRIYITTKDVQSKNSV